MADLNDTVKQSVAARLEAASDPEIAAGLLDVHSEAYDYLVSKNMLMDCADIYKKAMELYDYAVFLIKNQGDPDSESMKEQLSKIKADIQILTTPAKTFSNGTKFQVQFGERGNTDVLAQYSPNDNTVAINLYAILGNRGVLPNPKMPVEDLANMIEHAFKAVWPTMWTQIYKSGWLPPVVLHEMRHAFDASNKPYDNAINLNMDRYGKFKKISAREASRVKQQVNDSIGQQVSEDILAGNQVNYEAVAGLKEAAMNVVDKIIHKFPADAFVKPSSNRVRGIIKGAISRINSDSINATMQVDRANMVDAFASQVIGKETHDAVGRLPHQVLSSELAVRILTAVAEMFGYLSQYTEINARLAECMPHIAMLRPTNATVLSVHDITAELVKIMDIIGVSLKVGGDAKTALTEDDRRSIVTLNRIDPALADWMYPEEFNELVIADKNANKAIMKRIYTALDAANHIQIDPNDDCRARLLKMADYLSQYKEANSPKRRKTVVPPPMPKHPKPKYRGGYVKA